MNHHSEANKVLEDLKIGTINSEQAEQRLLAIEKDAYKANPKAEADGDITYCVATTLYDIHEWENTIR